MTLCKDIALVVHLIGQRVQKPGTPEAISDLMLSNKVSQQGEYLSSHDISPTVSKAQHKTLLCLIVSAAARFNACP